MRKRPTPSSRSNNGEDLHVGEPLDNPPENQTGNRGKETNHSHQKTGEGGGNVASLDEKIGKLRGNHVQHDLGKEKRHVGEEYVASGGSVPEER